MKKYTFLLMDLDYTLLDFQADMEAAFRRLYAQYFAAQRPYDPALHRMYEDCNNRWWDHFERQECTKQELYRNRFVDFLAESDLSGDPVAINDYYFAELAKGGTPYPGALALLKRLQTRYELYIITNGNAVTARTRIQNSGVLPLVKGYFISEAVGVGKPDPAYFAYVFAHIPGFEKEKALVIGDSPTSDIQGANKAGLDSLWYCPPTQSWPQNTAAKPTYTAKSYEEILALLDP